MKGGSPGHILKVFVSPAPSTATHWPLMKRAASLARNPITSACSSVPLSGPLRGVAFAKISAVASYWAGSGTASRMMRVFTYVGFVQFTRIPATKKRIQSVLHDWNIGLNSGAFSPIQFICLRICSEEFHPFSPCEKPFHLLRIYMLKAHKPFLSDG